MSILRVSVTSTKTEKRTGEKNGRAWAFSQQKVHIFPLGQIKYPDSYTITLPEDVSFYPIGEYSLDMNAHLVRGSFDSLDISRGIVLNYVSPLDVWDEQADFSQAEISRLTADNRFKDAEIEQLKQRLLDAEQNKTLEQIPLKNALKSGSGVVSPIPTT